MVTDFPSSLCPARTASASELSLQGTKTKERRVCRPPAFAVHLTFRDAFGRAGGVTSRGRLAPMTTRADAVTAARGRWHPLALFVLALAVVGMHSLGMGHDMGHTPRHGQVMEMVPMAPVHAAHGSAAHTGTVTPSTDHATHGTHAAHGTRAAGIQAPASTPGNQPQVDAPTPQDVMGSMAAMCLAVVSKLLALALLALCALLLRRTSLLPRAGNRADGLRVARLALRRLSLTPVEICVLRT